MANTFDSALPTLKDEARQMLGLFDSSSLTIFSDEQINARINAYGAQEGFAKLADDLAIWMSRSPIEVAQQLGAEVKWIRDRITALQDLAKRIRAGDIPIGPQTGVSGTPPAAFGVPEVDTSRLKIGS